MACGVGGHRSILPDISQRKQMVYGEESALIEATEAMIRGSINHPAHYQLENGMEAIDMIKGT